MPSVENKEVLISVVIPVKNGEAWLDACMQGIMQQTLFNQTEIIVIDSGSTDNSLQILQKYPVSLHTIPAAEFNHGLTRNYALQFCKGKYVVMTVQDAKPTDNLWLQKLLDGFSAAPNVAGVCGQQVVPHEKDKNPVDWFRPFSNPSLTVYQFNSASEFDSMSPAEKKNCCGWDDVNAMYLRSVLEKLPFQKITYGEDAVWAKDALRAGCAIVYNTAARVYHYHYEDWDFAFKRALTTMYLRYRCFGFVYHKPKRTVRETLGIVKLIWVSKSLTLKEKWSWYLYNRQQFNAFKEAHAVFHDALSKGEEVLDRTHEKFCGKPPVPLKEMN